MTVAKAVVLVVDDEVRSQEALRRTLEEDFTVLAAGSADEAAVIMGREFVHVLLCDQRMPGTSGVEFLKQVRTQWPDTVRIIISGFTDAEDIIAGIKRKVIDVKDQLPDGLKIGFIGDQSVFVRGAIQGVQVSAPFGKVPIALDVLRDVVTTPV